MSALAMDEAAEGMPAVRGTPVEDGPVDATEEKRLVRKVDLILLPILLSVVGLQYYDKAVLGSAAVFGAIKDLHLSTTHINPATGKAVVSTTRYSTASSAFYWGYIVAVLPFALLLQRVPIAKTLSACILLWGIVVILTVVIDSYQGFVVQRVFLGVLESSVSPGFVMITTQWYKREEQAARLGIWYSATGIFSMFSGLVNYGLGSAHGSLAPWKRMYLFAGAWTIVWSFVVLYMIPDSPRTATRWFSARERALLVRRTRSNQTGLTELASFDWKQAKEAACDVKIWLFLIMAAGIYVCNGAVTAFATQIIKSFGYTSLQTLALSIPAGVFTAVFIYIFTFLASRWRNSLTYLLPISCIPVIIGAALIQGASWSHRGVPLFGNYLLATFGSHLTSLHISGGPTAYVLLLAISTANVAGSTKKAISSGSIFVGYCVGNIIGPYTVNISERDKKFRGTWIALYCSLGIVCVCSLLLRYILVRENRKRDAAEALSAPAIPAVGTSNEHAEKASIGEGQPDSFQDEREDLTDLQNRSFRYTL
ncbi:hypothetical protein BMF94_0377 [Rhodotorula taiwanensis]|uniref:Major facilitator superfamily (MFS) profile domain-containing protein n=1 Tax=Rhodotorula taiwanensis TaxID=741276 RepID=A0A2S5BID2_9BASI|nr:hypothetical protein BMF94_0377 [Rhodotorula taiwanensis]